MPKATVNVDVVGPDPPMMSTVANETQPSSSNLATQPTTDAAPNVAAQAQTATTNTPAAKIKIQSNATKLPLKKIIVADYYDDRDYYGEPNVFDGMATDDADAFMASLWR